ncbi:hypothetical protein [Rhizobium sp. BK176]|uniref:hypothetical protein n=1 Tax=Rhizobium sp. BK176 TaxID=2587071 RepID=UPI002168CC9C|nr:hypothetical protein [Rhizobium sp. BK176]MCS4089248.1 hypothetical protein [Rhizobium sp. BK176]
MNYQRRKTDALLISAAMMLVAGHCLEWWGLLGIFSDSVQTASERLLRSFIWSYSEGMTISQLHGRQAGWMQILADSFLLYALFSVAAVAMAWRFIGPEVAKMGAIAVIAFTFVFDGPLLAGRAMIDYASDGHYLEAVDRGGITYTGSYLRPLTPLAGGVVQTPLHDERTSGMLFPFVSHLPAAILCGSVTLMLIWSFRKPKRMRASASAA